MSGARLALAAVFPLVPAAWRLPALAAGALSDFADGALSRHLHAESTVGRLLDPVADKALVLAAVGTLLAEGSLRPWEVLLVALRDVVVLAGCAALLAGGRMRDFPRMQPTMLGKAVTCLQLAYLLAVLACGPCAAWVLLPTATLSGLAGADYVRLHFRPRRDAGAADSH